MFIGIILSILVLLFLFGGGGFFLQRQRFASRLQREMPEWVARGWVEAANGEKILASAGGGRKHSVSTAFSILGVLLFGSGVITFFAANWDEISKVTKLLILFGSMWGAFAAAAWCRSHDMHRWLSEAALLLGGILFGANIMLIAQIYHIDSHYPDGVLVWGLGALLAAWLLQSKPVFVLSLVLATLWTGMEAFGFHEFHWPFLLVWGLHVAVMARYGWHGFMHLLMVSLLLWSLFAFFSFAWHQRDFNIVYLMQSYFFCYLILFLIGMHLLLDKRSAIYGEVVEKYAAVAALACFYVLTFPDFLRERRWTDGHFNFRNPADEGWLWVTALLMGLLAGLALWHRKRTLEKFMRQAYHTWGLGLMAAILAILLANMFVFGESGGAVAVVFNLLYFAALIWLIFFGMHTANHQLVNLAFLFFAITLLSRYFDTFWDLLDRSLFFMAGGALLVVLGIVLEKKRRGIVANMREGGEA